MEDQSNQKAVSVRMESQMDATHKIRVQATIIRCFYAMEEVLGSIPTRSTIPSVVIYTGN